MSLHSEVQKIDAQSKKCIANASKPYAYFKQTWLLTIRNKAKAKWFIAADQFPVNKFLKYFKKNQSLLWYWVQDWFYKCLGNFVYHAWAVFGRLSTPLLL